MVNNLKVLEGNRDTISWSNIQNTHIGKVLLKQRIDVVPNCVALIKRQSFNWYAISQTQSTELFMFGPYCNLESGLISSNYTLGKFIIRRSRFLVFLRSGNQSSYSYSAMIDWQCEVVISRRHTFAVGLLLSVMLPAALLLVFEFVTSYHKERQCHESWEGSVGRAYLSLDWDLDKQSERERGHFSWPSMKETKA